MNVGRPDLFIEACVLVATPQKTVVRNHSSCFAASDLE